MDRLEMMACRVASEVLAKDRPEDEFGAEFFDLREKAKALKEKWSQEAGKRLQDKMTKALTDMGFKVESVAVSLGKYKGSRFVTSAKVVVTAPTEAKAKGLTERLKAYSPRYEMKSWDPDTGLAEYNIR